MKIALDLSPSQADRLQDRAKSLGVAPEELARAAVADLLANPDEDFCAAAQAVLEKTCTVAPQSPSPSPAPSPRCGPPVAR